MSGRPASWPWWIWAAAVGVALGVVYTLSPLTVLSLAGLAAVVWRAGGDLAPRERRWYFAIVAVAILVRLAVIAGLFLTADAAEPYNTFFGDEELFKNRAIWLRNVALGVPVSKADVIYAFDEVGRSGHLFLMEFVQALVGDAPYGIHVLNAACFVAAALVLFRLARGAYGGAAALLGLAVVLFTPSLFMWSVSALKEPMHTLAAAIEISGVVAAVRAPRWPARLAGVAAALAGGGMSEFVRRGASIVAIVGVGAGLAAVALLRRPRVAILVAVVASVAGGVVFTRPEARERVLALVRQGAVYHVGHILTPGYAYRALDDHYYREYGRVRALPPRDAARFVVRAAASVVVEPRPWAAETRAMLAFVPEQVGWYVAVVLAIVALPVALRADALVTSLLAAHAAGVLALIAMTGGNIGTLVRHRGLAFALLPWLVLPGVAALGRAARGAAAPQEG